MASFMEAALSFFKTTTSTISVVVLTLLILLSVSSTFEVNKNVYNKTPDNNTASILPMICVLVNCEAKLYIAIITSMTSKIIAYLSGSISSLYSFNNVRTVNTSCTITSTIPITVDQALSLRFFSPSVRSVPFLKR